MSMSTHRHTERKYESLSTAQCPVVTPAASGASSRDTRTGKDSWHLQERPPSLLSPTVPTVPPFRPEPSDQPPLFSKTWGCRCENTALGLTRRHRENRCLRTSAHFPARRCWDKSHVVGGLQRHKCKRKHP